jgi:peptidoglycan/xylan/chitin deacetylase (PgdA/CDA1 family)
MVRLLIVVAGLAMASLASAQAAWPVPAAGESRSGDPEVVFTFDDGPNPKFTPKVLDILAQHRIQAVFFLVGNMTESENKKIPSIVARILREGHVIANHTMTHADLCRAASDPAREIDDGRAAIERVAGVMPVWFRAPYGSKCEKLEVQLAERHLTHFHWDVDPQEWRHGSAKRTASYITARLARSTGRTVVLLHDIHWVTVRALPEILDWIAKENARRAKLGTRQIRIVSAPQLALEQLPAGFVGWVDEATASARNLPRALASLLP